MKKIGIICAGDQELEPFLPLIKDKTITKKAMLTFYEGTLKGKPVVTLYCGVCKVNAALAAQILIDTFGVSLMINAGTAGGMASQISLFDTVVTTEAVYHDVAEEILVEFHPWLPEFQFPADQSLLAAARKVAVGDETIHFGRTVTGECFIVDEKRPELNEKYAPLSVDMETAAIAHVCYVNEVPFLAVRAITDTADHSGAEAFEENCEKASQRSAQVVCCLIDEL